MTRPLQRLQRKYRVRGKLPGRRQLDDVPEPDTWELFDAWLKTAPGSAEAEAALNHLIERARHESISR